jgi:hypothetical protein
VVSQVLKVL